MERLIGEDIEAEHYHSDVLGRTLDAIYHYGSETLYTQLSLAVVTHLELPCQFGHIDSTCFHVDGQYNSDTVLEKGVIKVLSR